MLNQTEQKTSILSFRTSAAKKELADEAAQRQGITRAEWLEKIFERSIKRTQKQGKTKAVEVTTK